MYLNRIQLIGFLGADPEVKHFPDGTAKTIIRIATSESWVDSNGEKQTKTTWHRLVAFRKLADICAQHLKKGRHIYAEGRQENRQYEENGEKKYISEVTLKEVKFLRPKDESENSSSSSIDDEIPF